MLLSGLAGIGIDDFKALEAMGLIAPVAEGRADARSEGAPQRKAASERAEAVRAGRRRGPAEPVGRARHALDYSAFTAALTQLISTHLGLRGFVLTLAVEKAGTIEDLQAVAQRALDQIRDRRGLPAAAQPGRRCTAPDSRRPA